MTLIRSLTYLLILTLSSSFADQTIDQLGPPWGYTFNGWEGPPVDIITYIPPKATIDTPILIVIPGASRDAQRFHASWLDLAKKKHFAVVTIGARKDLFLDEYSYNAGGVITNNGDSVTESKWLLSSIEPIFYDFKERYGFKAKKFYLFGHSAGGGFVHRFLLFKPNAPVIKAVAANPAFVTLPYWKEEYPFGLKNSPAKKEHLTMWFEKDMAIVLGEDDTGPRTKPLSNGEQAKRQGPNCLTRGKLLHKVASKKATDLASFFKWDLIIVPGVGHDNFGIAPVACDYLFGD